VRRIGGPRRGNIRVAGADRLIQGGRRLLVGSTPDILEVVAAHVALLVERPVEIGRMRCLRVDLTEGRRSGLVLVRGAGNLLAGAAFDDSTVVARPVVVEI
jgi:hypothetical protein